MAINLNLICKELYSLSQNTREYILSARKKLDKDGIHFKGATDLVSDIDIEAEKKLVSGLKTILPEAGILAEEGHNNWEKAGLFWIVDPIDGTTNFIHGIPCFAISIALMDKGEIILGIVHELSRDEFFSAIKDGPALLNDIPINIRDNNHLIECLIATGFPYDQEMDLNAYINIMTEIVKNTRGIRRLGSAAIDLAYVAAGRFDAFYEIKLNPWDVAAGAFIVQRAGGKVSDFKGGTNYIFGKSIVAGNEIGINYLLQLCKSY